MQTKLPDGSVMVCGVLPKDAEYRTVGQNSSSLTKFSVKCGEKSIEGEENPRAIWCNCTCWHSVARVAKDLKKGDCTFCIGKIESHEYEGKMYKELVCEFVAAMPKEVQTVVENTPISEDFETLSDDGVPF